MPAASENFNTLRCGDRFPWVGQRTSSAPLFPLETMAGRYIVLCFFGSLADIAGRKALEAAQMNREFFDDDRACFFGVGVDPQDEVLQRFTEGPGFRVFWDFDTAVSKACGIVPMDGDSGSQSREFRRTWLVVDPTLHVLAGFPFQTGEGGHDRVFNFLKRLPPPAQYGGIDIPAPVLVLPHVFEPELCRHLVQLYDADGGKESGVMRHGALVIDAAFKRRKDFALTDATMCGLIWQRVLRRVVPEIRNLFFMEITMMDRYMVGCYTAEDGGHFRPHRDNVAGVTAHRRFALSINLNHEFEGGEVEFPEYNRRGIKAPPGWAVVFPCAILHAVREVKVGRRYAFLPFLYDDAGAKLRDAELLGRSGSGSAGVAAPNRPELAPKIKVDAAALYDR